MRFRILVVDDDSLTLSATQILLESRGYVVDTANSAAEAMERVKKSLRLYALILLDFQLGDSDGATTAEALLKLNPNLYILIHSGDSSRVAVKTSWQAGAVGFIEKGGEAEAFLKEISNWCRKYEETVLTVSLQTSLDDKSEAIASLGMVGRSDSLHEIARRVKKYRSLADNVLILGETGTGKEKIARALNRGPESHFFAVNCATYSGNSELMEADLFGYVKGAFTGANKDHTGVFESANGGTVFLDEIQALDLKAQHKLLRAIQEKTVRPVGGVREYKVSFRLIAASKPELERMVEEGTFLPDLFERLNVLRIDVSPLRERTEDIEPLVAYFCEKYFQDTKERKVFLRRTVKYFETYSWPRNVRELENTVRRLCIDVNGEQVSPEHLDARFFETPTQQTPLKERQGVNIKSEIEQALSSSKSQREAARKLGLPESSLRNLIKKLDIHRSKTSSSSSKYQH